MDETKTGRNRKYSQQDLSDHLRRVNEAVRRMPRISDVTEYNNSHPNQDFPHPQTYVARYESWTNALEAIFPNSELCRELWRIASETDRRPTQSDLDTHGRFGTRAYQRRFGSWETALEEANFDPNYKIPREFLLTDLWRASKNTKLTIVVGRGEEDGVYRVIVPEKDVRKYCKYSYETFERRSLTDFSGHSTLAENADGPYRRVDAIAGIFSDDVNALLDSMEHHGGYRTATNPEDHKKIGPDLRRMLRQRNRTHVSRGPLYRSVLGQNW